MSGPAAAHPCRCEICVADRWSAKCPGCPDGHPSFWKTVVESPQWKAWEKYQSGKQQAYDVDECRECDVMSSAHFQAFMEFILEINS